MKTFNSKCSAGMSSMNDEVSFDKPIYVHMVKAPVHNSHLLLLSILEVRRSTFCYSAEKCRIRKDFKDDRTKVDYGSLNLF